MLGWRPFSMPDRRSFTTRTRSWVLAALLVLVYSGAARAQTAGNATARDRARVKLTEGAG
jgi:hypothetical protein